MKSNLELDVNMAEYELLLKAQKGILPKGLNAAVNNTSHTLLRTLWMVNAFQDTGNALMQAGGRLVKADMTFGRRHPILNTRQRHRQCSHRLYT